MSFQGDTLSPEPFGSELYGLLCARALALEIGVRPLDWATYFCPLCRGAKATPPRGFPDGLLLSYLARAVSLFSEQIDSSMPTPHCTKPGTATFSSKSSVSGRLINEYAQLSQQLAPRIPRKPFRSENMAIINRDWQPDVLIILSNARLL